MKKLLWVGDAGVPSGFAKATHNILETLRFHYDVEVLGMNFQGDPHPYRRTTENPRGYEIYAAAPGGDAFGIGRIVWMCDRFRPDVIVIQQDGWNFPSYIQHLQQFEEHKSIPVVGIVAVDGKNFQKEWLNGLAHAIFWTEFGLNEARLSGYTGPASVIPLGVDLNIFRPLDKTIARSHKLPDHYADKFIVGNINRNQPRKRLDLSIKFFAEWVKREKIDDAYLYLHVAPTGDKGVGVAQLAKYYGILDRICLCQPAPWYADSEAEVVETFNCFDVQISTTQGEGFGLTTFEGMACGVPQIVPRWAALEELCGGAATLINCLTTAIGPPYVNVIGGVADEEEFVEQLSTVYADFHATHDGYMRRRLKGLECAREDRFRWENIGAAYLRALETLW